MTTRQRQIVFWILAFLAFVIFLHVFRKILLPFGFLQVLINGIVLVYLKDSEVARDIALFVTSSALLVLMGMVIYRTTRAAPRSQRIAPGLAIGSAAR